MKKVLVTGYNGFIGKALIKELNNLNIEVKKLDIKEFDDNSLDLINYLSDTLSGCDTIFHIGAISSTLNQDVNRVMTCNYEYSKALFDASNILGIRIVFSSSASVYGINNIPSNLYGWSKYTSECYGNRHCNSKFVGLRYFNVYGPGEDHKGKMASVAHQVMTSKEESFPLFPGNPTRDFVYINDVVYANIYSGFHRSYYGIYEVGSGESKSFEDVLNILGKKYHYVDESNIPKGYQFKTKSDSKKWLPLWNPNWNLKRGLKDYMDHFSGLI